ncbi:PP2C family protein-serine/threonine phosphatase [Desulfovibrio inopinatus]|uniref:PP2C family protein-serine/threonine phosphatase n=1 Tax=Desulfovibrio inopinatus TaxID=102109 RepID=UPI00040E9588|nr:SpoIIE family protein phosphatase [Desulfovibrio inopinatus]
MKIRWKIFIALLLLVLPPLLLGRLYSVVETRHFGKTLSDQAAVELAQYASAELKQTVTLYSEALSESKALMEIAVLLLGHEAERLLTGEQLDPEQITIEERFAGTGSVIQSPPLPPSLTSTNTGPSPLKSAQIQFLFPPATDEAPFATDKQRLSELSPLYSKLTSENPNTVLWCFTLLTNGLMAVYPPQADIPDDFNPKRLLQDEFQILRNETHWTLVRDPFTRKTALTAFTPIYTPQNSIIGITGVTLPIDQLLLDDDLSRRWSGTVQSLLVVPEEPLSSKAASTQPSLIVVANHDFTKATESWKTPTSPYPIQLDDNAMRTIMSSFSTLQAGALEASYDGVPSIIAFKPLSQGNIALVVVIARDVMLKRSTEAEHAIMASISEILRTTGIFVLASILLVFLLAYFGSRVVTRPIANLVTAALRLAAGDFQAQAPVASRDELGELAQTFNSMVGQLRERIKLKDDLSLAMEVQQHLLPTAAATCPGFDIAGTCLYNDETGGDYYDYLPRVEDGIGVVVGDVTGHGIQAALLMASARSFLRAQAATHQDAAKIITSTNALLSIDTENLGRFVTLFFLEITPQNDTVQYISAGHDPALVYRHTNKTFEEFAGDGVPLGIMPEWDYAPTRTAVLTSGDIVVLATDGVWEARNPEKEFYGKSRLQRCIAAHVTASANDLVVAIMHDLALFRQDAPQADDITVVVIKRLND